MTILYAIQVLKPLLSIVCLAKLKNPNPELMPSWVDKPLFQVRSGEVVTSVQLYTCAIWLIRMSESILSSFSEFASPNLHDKGILVPLYHKDASPP